MARCLPGPGWGDFCPSGTSRSIRSRGVGAGLDRGVGTGHERTGPGRRFSVLMRESLFRRLVMPLVALAAGALLGGAMFHMLPQSLAALDGDLTVFVWAVAGLYSFHVLEQFLHWHHCHRPVSEHGPLGYMILAADGLHNLIGGLAVGSAFMLDVQLGVVTWLVAAAHEVPQDSVTSESWCTVAGAGAMR